MRMFATPTTITIHHFLHLIASLGCLACVISSFFLPWVSLVVTKNMKMFSLFTDTSQAKPKVPINQGLYRVQASMEIGLLECFSDICKDYSTFEDIIGQWTPLPSPSPTLSPSLSLSIPTYFPSIGPTLIDVDPIEISKQDSSDADEGHSSDTIKNIPPTLPPLEVKPSIPSLGISSSSFFSMWMSSYQWLTESIVAMKMKPIRLPPTILKPVNTKKKIAKYLEPFHTAALVTITLLLIAGILAGYLLLRLVGGWAVYLFSSDSDGTGTKDSAEPGNTSTPASYQSLPTTVVPASSLHLPPNESSQLIHRIYFYNLLLVMALFYIFVATIAYMVLTCKALRGGSYVDGVWMSAYCCIAGLICCLISAILTDSLQRELGLIDSPNGSAAGYEIVIDETDEDDEENDNNHRRHKHRHHRHVRKEYLNSKREENSQVANDHVYYQSEHSNVEMVPLSHIE